MKNDALLIAVIIGLLVGFVVGGTVATVGKNTAFAKTECARYSPLTGDFEIIKDK